MYRIVLGIRFHQLNDAESTVEVMFSMKTTLPFICHVIFNFVFIFNLRLIGMIIFMFFYMFDFESIVKDKSFFKLVLMNLIALYQPGYGK